MLVVALNAYQLIRYPILGFPVEENSVVAALAGKMSALPTMPLE